MNVGEFLAYFGVLAPWEYAENWDNVGLMLGSRKAGVKKLMLCMDVTTPVINESIEKGVDLIISHHPFLFSKLKNIDLDTMKGQQVELLIKNNINVIAAHTNLDVARNGVNDTLAETLGLTGCRKLKSYIPEGLDIDLGLGKIGELTAETAFPDFINQVKQKLEISNLRIIGPQPEMVKTVAVFCGSFDDELGVVKSRNADVLVTGDIKYHTALDAREMGLCIVDAGHFASERLILDKLKTLLASEFKDIEVICSEMERDPFIFS